VRQNQFAKGNEIDFVLRPPNRVQDHVGTEGHLELFGERDHGFF
jgi:hypothetical protein